ncbi:helix-turn-helix domain-containing protein [Lactiplantibacillus daowaiensis]|uniref:Helix-turn-helix domain-containing protein n=1 Tax=Lactiplantibacillus daowaiensis TaxID=2559918 RepID=A0ABW1S4Q1_9LACO|nr:AraC family transcriptional regulator [Lactiplantibacillus daowaiensis]
MKTVRTKQLQDLPIAATLATTQQPHLLIIDCQQQAVVKLDQQAIVLKPSELVIVRTIKTVTVDPVRPGQTAVVRLFDETVDLRVTAPIGIAGDNPLFRDLLASQPPQSAYVVFRQLTSMVCQGYCDQLARLEALPIDDRMVTYQRQAVTMLLLTELLRQHFDAGSLTDSHFPQRTQIRYTNQATQGGSIMTYLAAHLATATLQNVATYFGYQPNYFSRLFKTIFKQSFSQKLIQMRIEAGKRQLALTDQTVAQISQQVGYQNTANFNQHFKQQTRLTPTAYRAQLKSR